MKLFKKSTLNIGLISIILGSKINSAAAVPSARMNSDSMKIKIIRNILMLSKKILPTHMDCDCGHDDFDDIREPIYQDWIYDINHEMSSYSDQFLYASSTITDAIKIRFFMGSEKETEPELNQLISEDRKDHHTV